MGQAQLQTRQRWVTRVVGQGFQFGDDCRLRGSFDLLVGDVNGLGRVGSEGGSGVGRGMGRERVGEIGSLPGVDADTSLGEHGWINDHLLFVVQFKTGAAEIGAGDLESVEEEPGLLMADLQAEHQAHDLGKGHLDGIGIFENGEFYKIVFAGEVAEVDALLLPTLVEVAKFLAAQGGRAAAGAVGLDVVTTRNVGAAVHSVSTPPPWLNLWNQQVEDRVWAKSLS